MTFLEFGGWAFVAFTSGFSVGSVIQIVKESMRALAN